jgi:hypothetical protein
MTLPASPPRPSSGSKRPLYTPDPLPATAPESVASPAQAGPALRATVGSFLATRAVVVVAAWVGASSLIQANPTTYHKGVFTEAALMWDAAWYAGIARNGYVTPAPGITSNLAFPPLLPLLTQALAGFFSSQGLNMGDPAWGPWALAGVLISNIAFFAALYILWHLVALDHPTAVADRTLWLVAAFPLGVFWSAFYTESLFLLLAVGCVLAARRGLWPVAGALGGLAVLTRWAGLLLIAVLMVEWVAARRRGQAAAWRLPPRPAWLTVGWLGLVPLALGGYMLYLQEAYGAPWAVFQSQAQGWQHGLSFFVQTYADGANLLWQSVTQTGPRADSVLHWGFGNSLYMWLDLAMPLLFTGLGVLGWRRGWLRPGDLAWLALGLIFPLSLNTTISLTRYLMPLWPALIVGARLCTGRPGLERAWLVVSTGLLAVGAYLYANAKWIG